MPPQTVAAIHSCCKIAIHRLRCCPLNGKAPLLSLIWTMKSNYLTMCDLFACLNICNWVPKLLRQKLQLIFWLILCFYLSQVEWTWSNQLDNNLSAMKKWSTFKIRNIQIWTGRITYLVILFPRAKVVFKLQTTAVVSFRLF